MVLRLSSKPEPTLVAPDGLFDDAVVLQLYRFELTSAIVAPEMKKPPEGGLEVQLEKISRQLTTIERSLLALGALILLVLFFG
jgi:hypothetical protein